MRETISVLAWLVIALGITAAGIVIFWDSGVQAYFCGMVALKTIHAAHEMLLGEAD